MTAQRQAASRYVAHGDARLFVRDLGAGRPIVVVHGGPDFNHAYLLPELDVLADRFHLVYYDQRGRGRSLNAEQPESITLASEIEDLDQIRERIAADAVVLLAHSWGGVLALEYAVRHPDRVSALILLSPAPVAHRSALELRQRLLAARLPHEVERMATLRADPAYLAGDLAADAEYYRIHFRRALRRTDDVERVVQRLRTHFTPAGVVVARAIEDQLYDATWARTDYDLLPALNSVAAPALVLHGDHDLIPVEFGEQIVAALPGARLEVVPDCGHFIAMEQPRHLAVSATRFLGGAG